ncbi:murein L,D-transpeptidase [Shewanella canadensis]|uniref:Murein L,D-transpeptidase n=1 Tax=Shewanella canadensis TaxID=271096 RepID=A0A3S0RXX6_9GAMM|nr:L,D-transpeptidase family protein [Shewanella canadensis]RTR38879.1 murein L,D-transpeptidase [Shewanella canadensis]
MRLDSLLFISIAVVMMFACDLSEAKPLSDEHMMSEIYEQDADELLWFDQRGVSLNGMTLISLLDDLGVEVDIPLSIEATTLRKLADTNYTEALLTVIDRMSDLSYKELSVEQVKLLLAIKNERLAEYLDTILPSFDEVYRLRTLIGEYKKKVNLKWPTMSQHEFRLGQSSNEVKQLRWMLTVLGDLEHSELTRYREAIYDPMVIDGIKSFQLRHGLRVNGNLDKYTVEAINVTPLQRVEQMQRNLWRWIALSGLSFEKLVWINIPGYQLSLFEQGSVVLQMKVIIGKPSSQTPLLSTHLTQLTINPTWTPPASIIKSELLPLNAKEPGYLNHKQFELRGIGMNKTQVIKLDQINSKQLPTLLSQYRLVQAPGEDNALGKMRFTIINRHSIYLHDTPAKQLFESKNRAMSHGCIRLEKPIILSKYLVETDEKARELRNALEGNETRYFSLSTPISVYITYHTSWVDNSGKLQVRPDIYNLDMEI